MPTVARCIGADLEFSTKPPDVAIIEQGSGAVLRLHDAGSDENYLAIHIALSLALQKYLGEINAPVPAFLAFDQISRPYYPQRGEDESTIRENEEVSAMRRHMTSCSRRRPPRKACRCCSSSTHSLGMIFATSRPLASVGISFQRMR